MSLWASRITSALFTLVLLVWILLAGDFSWAIRTVAFAIIPLAFIWFPAQVYQPGRWNANDGRSRRAEIAIAVMGWLLLLIIAAVRLRIVASQ